MKHRTWVAVPLLIVLNAAILVMILRARDAQAPVQPQATLLDGMYCAWSTDGSSWTPPHALPMLSGDLARDPRLAWIGSRLFVVYESATSGGLARSEVGRVGVGLGFHLERSVPVQIAGEADRPAHPCLFEIPSGQYRLYYTAPAGNDVEIRSAISSDAVIWRREPGSRLAGRGIVDADVIMLPDGRYRVFYTLLDDGLVRSAVSQDGLAFTEEPGTRVAGGLTSTLFHPSGTYQMLYLAPSAPPLLRSALSTDGFAFRPDERFRSPFPTSAGQRAESPSMSVLQDGTWLMVCAYARAEPDPARTR